MRAVVVVIAVAGTLLVGCGAATSSAPVESATEGGGPAASESLDCPEGPPAREGLEGWRSLGNDGVVGALYNRTGSPVWVQGFGGSTCRLGPDAGVAFAGSNQVNEAVDAGGDGVLPPWFPQDDDGERQVANYTGTDLTFLLSSGPDATSPGIAVALLDPKIGYPRVWTVYRTGEGTECPSARGHLDTGGLGQGDSYVLKGPAPGEVLVKRLDDNKDIAREWVGTSDSNVDDWARIDLEIKSIGGC